MKKIVLALSVLCSSILTNAWASCPAGFNCYELTTPGNNVGIGTTSLINTLNANGGIAIGNQLYTSTVAPSNGAIIQGNVGVGSPNPGAQVDVNGTVRTTNFTMTGQTPSSGYVLTATDSNGDAKWAAASSGSSQWTGTGTGPLTYSSGNVGIGSTNPGQALDVQGTILTSSLVLRGNIPQNNWTLAPALPAPFTQYTSFGDSITTGNGTSIPLDSYVYLLATWLNMAVTNKGVGGTQIGDMTQYVYATTVPLSNRQLYSEEIGTNDVVYWGTNTNSQSNYQLEDLAQKAFLSIPASKKTLATACTPSGTWTSGTYYTGMEEMSSVQNSTETCTVTGTIVYVATTMVDGNAGTATVTVDGGSPTSLPLVGVGGQTLATNLGLTYGPALTRITGLSNTTHTVVITNTGSSGTTYFDWVAGLSGSAVVGYPIVLDGTIPAQNPSETVTPAYNTIITNDQSTLSGDGLTNLILVSNYNTLLNNPNYYTDNLHPNDQGSYLLAGDYYSALSSTPYTLPQQPTYAGGGIGDSNAGPGTSMGLGYSDLALNTGTWNQAVGYESLQSNTSGTGNTAYGYEAASFTTTTNNNTAVGYRAYYNSIGGTGNTALGYGTLYASGAVSNDVAVGLDSMLSSVGASNDVAVGYNTLENDASAGSNSAFGWQALKFNSSGLANSGFGAGALQNNTTGHDNIALGSDPMQGAVGPNYDLAAGTAALLNDSVGTNIALGYQSLKADTTGTSNIAEGFDSLFHNQTGSNDICIGNSSCNLTSFVADHATVLGDSSQVGISTSHAAAIGASVTNNVSNSILLGRTSDNTLVAGNLGVGTLFPQQNLDVWGTVSLSHDLVATSGGNVGVGTSIPSRLFEVVGNSNVTIPTSGSTADIGILNNNNSTNGNFSEMAYETTDTNNLVVSAAKSVGIFDNHTPSGVSGEYSISTRNAGTYVEAMRINANQNVGIGSSNPGKTLDVSGTVRTTNLTVTSLSTGCMTNTNGVVSSTGSSCGGSISSANPSATIGLSAVNGSASTFMTSDSAPPLSQAIIPTWTQPHTFTGSPISATFSGNVGIGSTNPGQALDVSGTVRTTNFTLNKTSGAGYVLTDTTGNGVGSWQVAASGSSQWTGTVGNPIYYANNVGIGTSLTPTSLLNVAGGVSVGTTYAGYQTPPTNGIAVQGNVGVGTWIPAANFDVEGTLSNAVFAGNVGVGTNITGNAALTIMNGNVGIGTWKPSALLTIGSGANPAFTFKSTGSMTFGASGSTGLSSGALSLVASGATAQYNNASGSVGTNSEYFGGQNASSITYLKGSSLTGSGDSVQILTGNVGIGTFNTLTAIGGNVGIGTVTASSMVSIGGCTTIGPVGACFTAGANGQTCLGYCSGAAGACTTCTCCSRSN